MGAEEWELGQQGRQAVGEGGMRDTQRNVSRRSRIVKLFVVYHSNGVGKLKKMRLLRGWKGRAGYLPGN